MQQASVKSSGTSVEPTMLRVVSARMSVGQQVSKQEDLRRVVSTLFARHQLAVQFSDRDGR